MPYFQIMLSGEGISVHSEDEVTKVIGFFTTRVVNAETKEAAVRMAKNLVMSEWLEGKYAASNTGNLPNLGIESVSSLSLLKGLFSKPKGYTFYGANE